MSEVQTIDLKAKKAVLEDGRVCEIVQMFDFLGKETDDYSEMDGFVVKVSETEWITDYKINFLFPSFH